MATTDAHVTTPANGDTVSPFKHHGIVEEYANDSGVNTPVGNGTSTKRGVAAREWVAASGLASGHVERAASKASGHASPGPYPSKPIVGIPPASAMANLSQESCKCLEHLAAHVPAPEEDLGVARQAAVLILLYQRPDEDYLRVLLTTRSFSMRRNPGQTALPGGKRDETDPDPVFTARREAFEEVGLPLSSPDIYNVAVLDPVLTVLPRNVHMKHHIVVTPIVAFLADHTMTQRLKPNPDEVESIFDHPLRAVHTGHVDGKARDELVDRGCSWWPLPDEFHSLEDMVASTGNFRMHRFRTRHSPIKGFTSNVLISASAIAFGSQPEYGHFAPGQESFPDSIRRIVKELPAALADDRGEWNTNSEFFRRG